MHEKKKILAHANDNVLEEKICFDWNIMKKIGNQVLCSERFFSKWQWLLAFKKKQKNKQKKP